MKAGKGRKIGTRAERQLLIATASDMYAAGAPPRIIGLKVDRTAETVSRWMSEACITPPDQNTRELWHANHIKDEAYAIHQKAPDIEAVALRLDAPVHIVRAAIYLKRQEIERGQPTE